MCSPITSNACEDGFLNIKFNKSQTKIRVALADSLKKKKKGLMFRESLDMKSGMLFVYEHPQAVNFWMKNTQIPLDIAFANYRGVITRVVHNTVPYSLDLISGGKNIKYVVEVNAGVANEINLFEGSYLQHQKFNGAASWQC